MDRLNEIFWIRKFYRQHLARYSWARFLKQLYLALKLRAIEIRNYIFWNVYNKCISNSIYLSLSVSQSSNPLARYSAGVVAFVCKVALRVICRLTGLQAWWYTMIGFSQYIGTTGASCCELVPARELPLEMPCVYPEEFSKFFCRDSWPLLVPSIFAFEASKVQVMGKSDLLFLEDQCLHHELYRFEQDFLFEEMHEIVSINANSKKLVRFKGQQAGSIPSGISLVGSATANYVHWLTETLPKLALIDEIDAYRDFPYIVDAGLHPNILESVSYLNSRGRNVIQLSRGEMLTVDTLIAISPVAYVPFDFKAAIEPNKLDISPGSALYSPDGLRRVRQLMVARLGDTAETLKRRLYLRRTGKARAMINSIEVEALLQELGFEIVEPEVMSFSEQVKLFSSAEIIVAQGGAALGNIIFSPAGCHVIVLTTWAPYIIHYYFSNLASIMEQRCTLVMCDPIQIDPNSHRAHMDIIVSVPNLKKAIQQ